MNEISLILLIEGYNIQRLTENLLFYKHFLVIVKKKKKAWVGVRMKNILLAPCSGHAVKSTSLWSVREVYK